MTLDKRVLNEIHQATLRYMRDLVKDSYHSDQQHLARCWTEAMFEVLKREGLL